MKVTKIILLKKPLVKVVYENGTEEVKTARGILMKSWGIQASIAISYKHIFTGRGIIE